MHGAVYNCADGEKNYDIIHVFHRACRYGLNMVGLICNYSTGLCTMLCHRRVSRPEVAWVERTICTNRDRRNPIPIRNRVGRPRGARGFRHSARKMGVRAQRFESSCSATFAVISKVKHECLSFVEFSA